MQVAIDAAIDGMEGSIFLSYGVSTLCLLLFSGSIRITLAMLATIACSVVMALGLFAIAQVCIHKLPMCTLPDTPLDGTISLNIAPCTTYPSGLLIKMGGALVSGQWVLWRPCASPSLLGWQSTTPCTWLRPTMRCALLIADVTKMQALTVKLDGT